MLKACSLSVDVTTGTIKFHLSVMHMETNNLAFRPDPTQTGLYSHRDD